MNGPGSIINQGAAPVAVTASSTTLSLRGGSNFLVSVASGTQSVTTIDVVSDGGSPEIMLTGTSNSNYAILGTGGNLKLASSTVNLGLGVTISLKRFSISGTEYWCQTGSGYDAGGAGGSDVVTNNIDLGTASTTSGTLDFFTSAGSNKVTIQLSSNPSGNRTYTLPTVTSSEILVANGAQTVSGAKTFSAAPIMSPTLAATSVSLQQFGPTTGGGYLLMNCIDHTITEPPIPTTGRDLTSDLPAGSAVAAVFLYVDTTYTTAGNAAAIGIGPTGSKTKYGSTENASTYGTGGIAAGAEITFFPTSFSFSRSAENINLWPLQTGTTLASADLNNVGALRIRIYFWQVSGFS